MSDLGKRIGRRIRELRNPAPQERWTQEDLAERAKISVSFLSMIERGERVAHVETLAALADALGVSLAELFVEPALGGAERRGAAPSDLRVRPLPAARRPRRGEIARRRPGDVCPQADGLTSPGKSLTPADTPPRVGR